MTAPLIALMQEQGIKSLDELARRLCEVKTTEKWPAARSVSAKLGLLSKDEAEWWLKRPAFIDALVSILRCRREDLRLEAPRKQKRLLEFENFPELPGLDLTREAACALGEFESDDVALRPWFGVQSGLTAELEGVFWLHFPPGTGRDVYWAELKRQTAYKAVEARCLADVKLLHQAREPICIKVDESQGERDVSALLKRASKAVLVCAPFAMPRAGQGGAYWRHKDMPLSDIDSDSTWKEYAWQLRRDWRARLLKWVGARLSPASNSSFDASALETWLAAFGDDSLFDTPRNLMGLCRVVHHVGVAGLPDLEATEAGEQLLRQIAQDDAESCLAFADVAWDWFNDPGLPWGGRIGPDDWKRLISTPSRLIRQLCSESEEDERLRLFRTLEERATERARLDLVDTVFVAHDEQGRVALAPRFVVELVTRGRLQRLITRESRLHWGALCFDADRFLTVQRAFALLSIEELAACATQVLAQYQDDATGVGASEAIFCALSTRDLSRQAVPESLRSIVEIVLTRMVRVVPDTPSSMTIGWALPDLWIGACWSVSLGMERPRLEIPEYWASFFPGWFDLDEVNFSDVSWMLDWQSLARSPRRQIVKTILQSSKAVVERLAAVPASPPGVLIPYLVARFAGTQSAEAEAGWWNEILDSRDPLFWLRVLIDVAREPGREPARIAASIFNCYGELSQGPRMMLSLIWEWLREHLIEFVAPDELLLCLSPLGLGVLKSNFNKLSPSLQVQLCREIAARATAAEKLDFWMRIRPDPSKTLFDAMLPLVSAPDSFGASWLWQADAARTLQLLRGNGDPELKCSLVESFEGDARTFSELLDVVKQDPSLFPSAEARRAWALRCLPNSGKWAPDLMVLVAH
jgi:hypothetical protein